MSCHVQFANELEVQVNSEFFPPCRFLSTALQTLHVWPKTGRSSGVFKPGGSSNLGFGPSRFWWKNNTRNR